MSAEFTPRIAEPPAHAPAVVLASQSPARRRMLAHAGVPASTDAPGVDETEVKAAFAADRAEPDQVAEALAEMKARRVAGRHPGALVLGADQMLACAGTWYDKPESRDDAHAQLAALSGRTHRLVVTVVVIRDGTRLWHTTDAAELTMRPLSERFIANYLNAVGDAALGSVGGYQLEGFGAQLFTRVRGDYFTILGLPLLPLLDFLREHEVVPT